MDGMIILMSVAANLYLGLFAAAIWTRLLKKPQALRTMIARAMALLFTVATVAWVVDLFSTAALAAPVVALVAVLVTALSLVVLWRRRDDGLMALTDGLRRDWLAMLWLLAAPVAGFFIVLGLFQALSVKTLLAAVAFNVFVLGASVVALAHGRLHRA